MICSKCWTFFLVGGLMGLFGRKEEEKEAKDDSAEKELSDLGKYAEPCSVCGKAPCDKRFGGHFFHKKCFRQMKKAARGML
jgi:hypothetical protein